MKKEIRSSLMTRFANANIAIVGFSKEGVSTHRFLRALSSKMAIRIFDEKDPEELLPEACVIMNSDKKLTVSFGKNYLDAQRVETIDVVFRSPGVSPWLLSKKFPQHVEFTSQTALFLEFFGHRTIGVTGTKGKSTTSSLIYHILKQQFPQTYLIGNIGYPPLDALKYDHPSAHFVFELSSHQLFDVHHSPHTAVFLNLYPEHFDYYDDLQQYKEAKFNIGRFQGENDVLIYNKDDELARELSHRSEARTFSCSLIQKEGAGCFLRHDVIICSVKRKKEEIMKRGNISLIGDHNISNVLAAILAGRILGVSTEKIANAVSGFSPLPHRLEFLGTYSGIRFINDSLATIPQATIAAIRALGDQLGTVIVGGYDRGLDFTELIDVICNSSIEAVVTLPDTGKKIKKFFTMRKGNKPPLVAVDTLEQAVNACYQKTARGKVCLLSPAAASFNMFKDYRERGETFRRLVEAHGSLRYEK